MSAMEKNMKTQGKMKQKDLARLVNVHPVWLNAVLRGRGKPSPALALAIERESGGKYTRMKLLYPKEG